MEIGNLKKLQILDITDNHLNGTVPSTFSALVDLRKLSLARNSIQGTIPSFISGMEKLDHLSLGVNNFYGSLPTFLGSLRQLTYLSLNMLGYRGVLESRLAVGCAADRLETCAVSVVPIISRYYRACISSSSFLFPDKCR